MCAIVLPDKIGEKSIMDYRVDELSPDIYSHKTIHDLDSLLEQLAPGLKVADPTTLRNIRQSGGVVIVARDPEDTIVGMATLASYFKLARGRVGVIEDVVVDEAHRCRGIASMLMERLMTEARNRDMFSVRLTSNDSRKDAHRLYEKFGFKRVHTNFFGIVLGNSSK